MIMKEVIAHRKLTHTSGRLSESIVSVVGHFNLDVALEICNNPSCKVWLHEDCLREDTVTKKYERLSDQVARQTGHQWRSKNKWEEGRPRAKSGKASLLQC